MVKAFKQKEQQRKTDVSAAVLAELFSATKKPEYQVSDCNRNQVKKHANEPATNYNRKTSENGRNKKNKRENVSETASGRRRETDVSRNGAVRCPRESTRAYSEVLSSLRSGDKNDDLGSQNS
jgi:DNA-directed RNA polymerase subunit M/transcription elongation factor TFIIS